jgi:hypothetical protein
MEAYTIEQLSKKYDLDYARVKSAVWRGVFESELVKPRSFGIGGARRLRMIKPTSKNREVINRLQNSPGNKPRTGKTLVCHNGIEVRHDILGLIAAGCEYPESNKERIRSKVYLPFSGGEE